MRVTETYTEYVKRERTIRVECDKCKKDLTGAQQNMYARNDLSLSYEHGSSYPDGGSGEGVAIDDLCHECTLEAFRILEAAGFRVRRYDWDY